MSLRILAAACLAQTLTACPQPSVHQAASSGPLVYEVDPDSVRALGWCSESADDAEALIACADVVRRRLAAFGPEVDPSVTVESQEDRLAVSASAKLDGRTWSRLDLALQGLGRLEFLIVADEEAMREIGTDRGSERRKLDAWLAANPGKSPVTFNQVGSDEGGPHELIEWMPSQPSDWTTPEQSYAVALPRDIEEWFGAGIIARFFPTRNAMGDPAIAFEISEEHREAFGDFTDMHVGRQMAIVLNGEVCSAPSLESRISWGGTISGRFTKYPVLGILAGLRAGTGPLHAVR